MSVLIHNHMLGQMEADTKQGTDFIGFTYNGKHSSDLGIVRISNGSRFDENLLPTMQDKTVQVPGGDGAYYFGSYYTQRQFSVSFAFDSLTEKQVATLKSHFGDKKIHDLVFDERPYKIYKAKVTGSATLKYIPFSEGATNRLYKGEGTLQFTCYQPFARCENKWLEDYSEWKNLQEWQDASGLKESQGAFDSIQQINTIPLWNPGDLESDFQLKLNFTDSKIVAGKINLDKNSDRQLVWKELTAQGEDAYIKINTKLNLIEGYNSNGVKTGNIYNQYISAGTFFKIPQGEELMVIDLSVASFVDQETPIEYNYYYF